MVEGFLFSRVYFRVYFCGIIDTNQIHGKEPGRRYLRIPAPYSSGRHNMCERVSVDILFQFAENVVIELVRIVIGHGRYVVLVDAFHN